MSLKVLSEQCRSCEYVNDCDKKRMAACAYIQPQNIAEATAESYAMPVAADMAVKHRYRDVKIAEGVTVTIDIEDMKKQIERDFYKQLNCGFLGGAV